jgi:hypothetical protein
MKFNGRVRNGPVFLYQNYQCLPLKVVNASQKVKMYGGYVDLSKQNILHL